MIDTQYALDHLRGVWRLALRREDWRRGLDISVDGFFKSLWAIALTLPFAFLAFAAAARAVRSSPEYADSDFVRAPLSVLFISDFAATIIVWGISLGALVLLARRLGAGRNAASLLISYNWSQLLGAIVAVAPALVAVISNSIELFALLALPTLAFGLYLFWMVIRRNTPIEAGPAVLFIGALIVIDLGLSSVATNLAISAHQAFS